MLTNQKKFIDILDHMFLGVKIADDNTNLFTDEKVKREAREKQGFVNLLKAKSDYFNAFKDDFIEKIHTKVGSNEELKAEFYDKLYDFFHRYFNPTGSVYYHQTPLFYNVFTKSYEKITSKDTELFYKTNMLFYVKSDKIYKAMTINLSENKTIKFNVDEIGEKNANQKSEIIFEVLEATTNSLTLKATHAKGGKKTKKDDIIKEAQKQGFLLDEESLQKAINSFNKQSSFDFFINKNAREFLSTELDLWIYQYLFSQKNVFSTERIKQIEYFKEIALTLIDFIAKFEDELVKIWTKPRFVLDSHYLVSLSTLKEKGFDLEKITKHKNYEKQKKEWENLGLNKNEGLFSNETLAIDTRHFSDLKEEIESLFKADELNGVLIKSENYQALNSILPRFKGKVDLIYIDPPYNTKNDDFIYLDKFNHASWLTMMSNRLELAKEFLQNSGSIFISIDDNEQARLKILCDEIFGEENFMANLCVELSTTQGMKVASAKKGQIVKNAEYILCYAKDNDKFKFQRPLYTAKEWDDHYSVYIYPETKNKTTLLEFLKDKYPHITKQKIKELYNNNKNFRDYIHTNAKDIYREHNAEVNFNFTQQQQNVLNSGKIVEYDNYLIFKNSNNKIRQFLKLSDVIGYTDDFETKFGLRKIRGDWWAGYYKDMGNINKEGDVIFKNGKKPMRLIKDILKISTTPTLEGGETPSSLVLDFFAGSGTTLATALKMGRKFIGVEMGEHFDTVILPRLIKTLSGVQSGISKECEYRGGGIVKYYSLESYEQILRTLSLDKPPKDYITYSQKYGFSDPFLFDTKLSNFFNENLELDFSKIYKNIDLKETLLNATGREVKEIDFKSNEVLFKDEGKGNLIELLKRHLIW